MAKTKTPRKPAPFRGRFHTAHIEKRSWERTASVVVDLIDISQNAYARYLLSYVGEGYTASGSIKVSINSHKDAITDSNRRFTAWLERATAWVEAHNRRAKARLNAKRKS